jgi:hypothetical protein
MSRKSKSPSLSFPHCIFCGGTVPATTVEHCPPRSLFDNRLWPEGFEFPACAACNGGTSDQDLLVAMISQMDPLSKEEIAPSTKGRVLAARKQMPRTLHGMLIRSPIEARRAATKIGLKPEPGQSCMDLPIVKITPDVHAAVRTFASKLTKATYFMQTKKVFPAEGGILFHWFTNAEMIKPNGSVPALDFAHQFAGIEPPLRRNGKDLSNQVGLRLSFDADGQLYIVLATFRRAFGFVTIGCAEPGQAANFHAEVLKRSGKQTAPFEVI